MNKFMKMPVVAATINALAINFSWGAMFCMSDSEVMSYLAESSMFVMGVLAGRCIREHPELCTTC